MPTISVIIPVYNAAPFLREALDSLLAQTYEDFEAIAVNDGSTDNSLEILMDYAVRDKRVRILNGPNGGYGKAMNRGMDVAIGKYMAILEPDDYLPREAYATLVSQVELNGLEVVRGANLTFYEMHGIRQYQYALPPSIEFGVPFCPLSVAPVSFWDTPAIWCNLYDMKFLRSHGIRFQESPGASYQDIGFFILCAVHAQRYMIIPDAVYVYRTDNPASSIKHVDAKSDMLLLEYEYVRKTLMCNDELWQKAKEVFYWRFISGQKWVFQRLSEHNRLAYARKLRAVVERYFDVDCNHMTDTTKILMSNIKQCHNGESIAEFFFQPEQTKLFARTFKFMGIKWLVKTMCAESTVFHLLGVPVLKRVRVYVWQNLSPALRVANGVKNKYYIVNVPIWETKSVTFGKLDDVSTVPAMVNAFLL